MTASLLILSVAGCSNNTTSSSTSSNNSSANKASSTANAVKEKITLKVWGPQEGQASLTKMVDEFISANPDKEWDISYGIVAEGDAQKKIAEDPTVAADIFAFENGQLNDLVAAGSLYEVTRNKDKIIADNMPGAVEAASADGKLYAYPMTADNGYFLYYDKSVLSDDDVKTLDSMLETAQKAGKKILMKVADGWYIASFFLGAGGTLKIEDGKQVCDFNNEQGVKAGESIKAFTANPAFISGNDAIITGSIGDSVAAAVSGTWNYDAIKERLGENFGATKLPTFTLDGAQVQMGSFAGYKLIGVNSLTKHPLEAMELAEWLTNEQNQLQRFKDRGMGPSNIEASNDQEVQANPVLSALAAQNAFATPQNNVKSTYWLPAEAFGLAMENKDYSKSIKDQLDAMVAQING